MDEHDATELAYKNGYEKGERENECVAFTLDCSVVHGNRVHILCFAIGKQ